MIPTLTVQMQSKLAASCGFRTRLRSAFTLAEITVVVFIVSLLVAVASLNLSGWLTTANFKSQAHDLIAAFQKASTTASESGRRYEIIIDLAEQSYILRQITSADLTEILPDDIILENDLGENCRVAFVQFDDGEYTDESRAKFRVGRFGWQYGGRIGLLDSDGNEYTILINRLSPVAKLHKGTAEMLQPKFEDEVPF